MSTKTQETEEFNGFHPETVKFLKALKRHNTKPWFDAHKADYEIHVLDPARRFIQAMGDRLQTVFPGIHAEPRINRSLFRIYRDVRFSPDKSPYKTHLGIIFWEGEGPRMECPGFYFHLEPPRLMLGGGVFRFSPEKLRRFRRAAVEPVLGRSLAAAVDAVRGRGEYTLGGRYFKRIPVGCKPGSPNADLLLHNGLYAGYETTIPEALTSARLVDTCWKWFAPLKSLHVWLTALNE